VRHLLLDFNKRVRHGAPSIGGIIYTGKKAHVKFKV